MKFFIPLDPASYARSEVSSGERWHLGLARVYGPFLNDKSLGQAITELKAEHREKAECFLVFDGEILDLRGGS